MKTIYISITLFFLVLAAGCSNDSTTGPIGGNVTFAITGQGDPTSYTFGVQPSVDVRLSGVVVAIPSTGFVDTLVNSDPTYVFSKDMVYTLDPYVGVQQGQAWTFSFTGTTVTNNSPFSTAINFTVP